MPLIPDDKISEIRDRTDIVQVIGEYVSLRKSGINHKGLCPFHAEKSPSFNVNQAKQMYHCFGCAKSGDVIRFLMEHDGKTFMEVIRELARRAGIDLPEPEVSPAERDARVRAESDRSRMLKLNRLASDFFRAEYAAPGGERARRYVEEKRGISSGIRDQFLLGYAPPGWDALTKFLEQKRVPHELCESAGLLRVRDNAKLPPGAPPTARTHFDLFRDRVMFPLLNAQAEVIAFSARALEDTAPDGQRIPKYINSPETLLYKKGENLYGLHAGRQAIRKADRAILVEGNFDVLMMHERGFAETVAPMGTALTPAQVRLLGRAAPRRVFMLLDGDAAGSSAAARNVSLFLDEELLSFVALLPQGDDPDTFVARQGNDALEVLLAHARESVEYFCEYGWSRSGASVIERATLLEEEAAPMIRKVKLPAARQRYAERLSLTLDMPTSEVQRVLRGAEAKAVAASSMRQQGASASTNGATASGQGARASQGPDAPVVPMAMPDSVDLQLVALLADHPRLMRRLATILRTLDHEPLRNAVGALCDRAENRAENRDATAKLDVPALAERIDPRIRAQVVTAAMAGSYADVDPERTLDAIAKKRQDQRDRRELDDLRKKLAEGIASSDPSSVNRLTVRIKELNQAVHGLKG